MSSHPNPLLTDSQATTFRQALFADQIVELNPFDLLATRPGSLDVILGYLRLYEAIGLGRVCKRFRKAVSVAFPDYDPFGDWKNLGYSDVMMDDSDERLEGLARLAYRRLTANISHVLTTQSGFTQPCALLAYLSGHYGLDRTNCMAALKLKVGGATMWETHLALNFHNTAVADYIKSLGYSQIRYCDGTIYLTFSDLKHLCNYDQKSRGGVAKRHGEWRLILKWLLTYPHIQEVHLQVDKFCCVFCAAQLHAMGLTALISASSRQAFKALKWYNFAPVVMFFKSRRSQLWGDEVEALFEKLPALARQRLLFLIVQQASSPSGDALSIRTKDSAPVCGSCRKTMRPLKGNAEDGTFTVIWQCPDCSAAVSGKRKLDSESKTPKSAPAPKKGKTVCPNCGAALVSRFAPRAGRWGWACPNWRKSCEKGYFTS